MSCGYLIITDKPCPVLSKTRYESFTLIDGKPNCYIYFLFFESNLYTEHNNSNETVLTEYGMAFLEKVYAANQGRFIFVDTLLKNREGEADFSQTVLKQLEQNNIPTLNPAAGIKIKLRQPYFIEMKNLIKQG